jgi:hypothetical protein
MSLTRITVLCASFFNLSSISAQPPKSDPLLRWMDQIAQRQLQRREGTIAEIHGVADAELRKHWVRQKFLSLIGGLLDYNGPLNPRITGRLQSANSYCRRAVRPNPP